MARSRKVRLFTLVQRELQEYKVSLVFTPVTIGLVLSVLMLGSVLLANRITVMGDTVLDIIISEKSIGPVITINIDDPDDEPEAESLPGVEMLPDVSGADEDEWNFSREWRFEPNKREKRTGTFDTQEVGSLNAVLHVIHGFLLLIMIIITVNYLLSCLFSDRKDRSILFWRSMPVSEWEEVLVRLGVALLVAPAIYIAVSLVTQVAFVLLAMLLVWRMDMDPYDTILGNIEFSSLLLQQVGGWLLTALWVAPVYAYLMLASAWAKRSPFLVAIAPVLALVVGEGILLGTDFVGTAIKNHIPHYIGGESVVGFYINNAFWAEIDYLSLMMGLVFAVAAVVASVYLRRYRFEI